MIGINADVGRDVQAFFHHLAGGKVGRVLFEGQRSRLGVHRPAADGGHVKVRLQNVAGAAEN